MALTLTALEDLESTILQYVPKCPPNFMRLQLSHAVRNFLAKTNIWTASISVTIESGTTVYELPFVSDVFVQNIESATLSDTDVLDLVEITGDKEITITADDSVSYDGEAITIKCVVVPFSLPCEIPSRLVNLYSDFFIAGAVYNIARVPNKPYTNQKIENSALADWKMGLTRASNAAATGNRNKNIGFTG